MYNNSHSLWGQSVISFYSQAMSKSDDDYVNKIHSRLHEETNARKEREKRRRRVLIDQLKAHELKQACSYSHVNMCPSCLANCLSVCLNVAVLLTLVICLSGSKTRRNACKPSASTVTARETNWCSTDAG